MKTRFFFEDAALNPSDVESADFGKLMGCYYAHYDWPLIEVESLESGGVDVGGIANVIGDEFGDEYAELVVSHLDEWKAQRDSIWQKVISTPGYYPGAEMEF